MLSVAKIAIGDAYGACFEYSDPTPERPNDLSGYTLNPTVFDNGARIGGGRYTDDTQMSIALAEAMLAGEVSRGAIAGWFVHGYRRDPRPGYSRAMQSFIASCTDGADLLARIAPASDKSGAAMRACPVGLLADEGAVLGLAETQARITHDTDGGVRSAQAVALMVHGLLYGKTERAGLPGYVAARVPGPWSLPWEGPVGSPGMDAARAALWAVARHDGLAAILRASVGYTGDVDTVAAVALGVASCAGDVADDLPRALIDGLEDGPFGARYLAALDDRLAAFARAQGALAR